MKTGGTIRVRVLDEHGKAVPKTTIFFQHWRGPEYQYFEFDNVDQNQPIKMAFGNGTKRRWISFKPTFVRQAECS